MIKIQMAEINNTDRYNSEDDFWETIVKEKDTFIALEMFIEMINNEELDIDIHWYRIVNNKGEIINL